MYRDQKFAKSFHEYASIIKEHNKETNNYTKHEDLSDNEVDYFLSPEFKRLRLETNEEVLDINYGLYDLGKQSNF